MRKARREFPKHFDGKRFFNPDAPQAPGLLEVIRWKLARRPETSPDFISDIEQSVPPRSIESSRLRATLINHSTVLLQQSSCSILTDPIWSERASPVSWAGPRRRRKPGVAFEDLPPVDAVVLSHNHYDHLDVATLRRLAASEHCTFIVPARGARLLRSKGIGPVRELDWGESILLRDCTIHSVPAMHFSSRTLWDRNRTLWCGYVMEWKERLVYFAGDTAFGNHFAAIRQRFGSPDLALLPIGAYQPRWFMSRVHLGPDEAIRAHEILDARTSIAIHHGTFQLGDEAIDTPRKELARCSKPESFLILNNGEEVGIS